MLKSLIELFVNSLFYITSYIPLKIRIKIGRFLGTIFYLVPTRDKKTAINQLIKFLGINKQSSKKIVLKMYQNLGQTTLEIVNFKTFFKNKEKYFNKVDFTEPKDY